MSNTKRYVEAAAFDEEHWERFGIKSKKHLTKDRTETIKERYIRWSKYFGRGFNFWKEQRRKKEDKSIIEEFIE